VTCHRRPPANVDSSQPNSARVCDYLLGGKDNYETDRAVVRRILEIAPDTRSLAWFSRKFLIGAARLAAESGVRQFVDIGAGIPTSPSVYETVIELDSGVRVASIDYDPVVHAHNCAMLTAQPGVFPMLADFREPDDILERLHTEAQFDLSLPIALLVVGVLHYVTDDEHPAEIIARFRDAMVPTSCIAFTHAATSTATDLMQRIRDDTIGSPAQCTFRSHSEVAALFDGFKMLDPGVAPIQEWLGDDLPATRVVVLGGIGQKPA
jgi:hypothetical protein